MSSLPSLLERHADATQRLILDAAVDLLERSGVPELTMRAVAKNAGMSERTLFRYFATRDEFLDAVAAEVGRRIAVPELHETAEALRAYPRALYLRFEERADLVKAALHTELYHRLRESVAQERWQTVRRIVDAYAPQRSARERKLVAANIRYYLAATSWHYYRFYFKFTLTETIDCAQLAVRLALDDIGSRAKSTARTA